MRCAARGRPFTKQRAGRNSLANSTNRGMARRNTRCYSPHALTRGSPSRRDVERLVAAKSKCGIRNERTASDGGIRPHAVEPTTRAIGPRKRAATIGLEGKLTKQKAECIAGAMDDTIKHPHWRAPDSILLSPAGPVANAASPCARSPSCAGRPRDPTPHAGLSGCRRSSASSFSSPWRHFSNWRHRFHLSLLAAHHLGHGGDGK